MQHWPTKGWPERPGAWLMTTAMHRQLYQIRHKKLVAQKQLVPGGASDVCAANLAPDPLDVLLADEAGGPALELTCSSVWVVLRKRVKPCVRLYSGLAMSANVYCC